MKITRIETFAVQAPPSDARPYWGSRAWGRHGTGAAPDAIIVNISSAEYHAQQLVRIIAGENWDK